ncbi:hypothetical protein ACHAAC_03675 [Aeromicrobium sp. CF4.19]|uniref:hypothetical protein n=1 Tax=Aeromicrobium sp. CF4.19 TaxID=3373082 RepID=UPI003EE4A818
MTRRLALLDRVVTLVVGVALAAGGLALVDWQLGAVLPWPESLDATAVSDLASAAWFAWAVAGATLLLGLLGLWWLLAHTPRPQGTQVRVESGDRTGSVRVDLSSIATAAADRFGSLAPVLETSGACRTVAGHDVVELRARVDLRADAELVHAVAARTTQEVAASLDDAEPTTRVLLDAPRRLPLTKTSGPARVH